MKILKIILTVLAENFLICTGLYFLVEALCSEAGYDTILNCFKSGALLNLWAILILNVDWRRR